ncbi:EPL1-like protein [Xylariomycetidae sp. FL0641]|nr:EPL1-like protein [Xylariomycetidae sp. FL0641]
MSTRKVRFKKLNRQTPLPVLREHQIDPTEYESLTTVNQIATGVEQAEENEYHLQAALKGAGASTDNEIPVPPPQQSSETNYDELYPTPYIEPRNYIKFSDTVEEMLSGPSYDMTTEDDAYLKTYNAKRPANAQLSEDAFEEIMEIFEGTAKKETPFAAVDNTVTPFEDMQKVMNQLQLNKAMQSHARIVYEHWKARRQEVGNEPLHPSLKPDLRRERDEYDPYVCFRRRDPRQTRKTRARDAHVAEKLKKLRRDLEDGRQLIVFSHQREILKRELLKHEKLVYEQRQKLREMKVRLNIKADDDDLFNTKPRKKPPPIEPPQQPRPTPHARVGIAVRPDGSRSMEPLDLTLLSDKLAEREQELRNNVEIKVQNHRRWNQGYVDLTAEPLPPAREEKEPSFRPAKMTYLMTPPASSASDSMEIDEVPLAAPSGPVAPFVFKGVPPEDMHYEGMPLYRRRVGRQGRLHIDRRAPKPGLGSPPRETGSLQSDRWKYDQDSDDDDDPDVYLVDSNSLRQMKFRSTIPPPAMMWRRQGMEAPQVHAAQARPALPQNHAAHQAIQLAQAAQAASASASAVSGPQASPAPQVQPQNSPPPSAGLSALKSPSMPPGANATPQALPVQMPS